MLHLRSNLDNGATRKRVTLDNQTKKVAQITDQTNSANNMPLLMNMLHRARSKDIDHKVTQEYSNAIINVINFFISDLEIKLTATY